MIYICKDTSRDASLSSISHLSAIDPPHTGNISINMVATTALTLSILVTSALAVPEPAVTAAAELFPRQSAIDPALVGYISSGSGCAFP